MGRLTNILLSIQAEVYSVHHIRWAPNYSSGCSPLSGVLYSTKRQMPLKFRGTGSKFLDGQAMAEHDVAVYTYVGVSAWGMPLSECIMRKSM